MKGNSAAIPVGQPMAITPLQGGALVLLSGIMFSFGGLALRSTSDIGAWEYLFYRGSGMLLATIAILFVRYWGRLSTVLVGVRAGHLGAGLILGVLNCTFIVSLTITTVAFVLFFQALSPIAAAYFSWLLMRERLSRNVVVATGVSILGVLIMVAGTLAESVAASALIAAFIPIGFGLYATLIRSTERIDPVIPVLVGGVVTVVGGLAVVLIRGGFDASASDAAVGLFAGSVLLAFPLAVFNAAQRVVPAPETTLLLMIEVLLGPLWVWWFASEDPEPTTLIGGAIVLGAIVWLTLTRPARSGRPITSRG